MQNSGPVRRRQKRWAAFAAVLAILISVQLWREGIAHSFQPLHVAAPAPRDLTESQGFYPTAPQEFIGEAVFTHVARLEGTFRKDGLLIAELFFVEDGSVARGDSLLLGRNLAGEQDAFWKPLDANLSLAEIRTRKGRILHLGFTELAFGRGFGDQRIHDAERVVARTLTGTLQRGVTRLAYISGDREFNATADMSPEGFAHANTGRFVVVAVRLD